MWDYQLYNCQHQHGSEKVTMIHLKWTWLYLSDFTSQIVVSQGLLAVALLCQNGMLWGLQYEFWQEYGVLINTRIITSAGKNCKGEYQFVMMTEIKVDVTGNIDGA
jgi:hypothetical protein